MSVKGFDMSQKFLAVMQLLIVVFDGLSQYGEQSSVELFFFALAQLLKSHFQFGWLAIALETQNKITPVLLLW